MNQLPATRHSLLLRLADVEDGAAWGEFMDVYERAIFRFACSCGLQPADAEDVTQKVLAAVMEKVRDWDPDSEKGRFGAWLFRVTRNLAAKSWKEHVARPRQVDEHALDSSVARDVPEASESEAKRFQTGYRKAVFHWAADRVRDRVQSVTWQAFWMSAIERQAVTNVATKLEISVASVYTAKCRMLARIRTEIEEFENEFSLPQEEE